MDHSCYDIAPANLKVDEVMGTTYVFKQPETLEEEAQCREVIDYCPVEAFRNDGDSSD
jgi:ferredoxin